MKIEPLVIVMLLYVNLLWDFATEAKSEHKRSHGSPTTARKVYICTDSRIEPIYDSSMCLIPGFCPLNNAKYRSPSERTTDVFNGHGKRCPKGYAGTAPPRICPHYFVLNYDPNRIPSLIFEARCSCEGCRTMTGNSTHQCQPVLHYRYVLIKKRKAYPDDTGCYTRTLKAFSVGCQCIGSITGNISGETAAP